MTGRLDNEHILVTGGGRGIGSAIVEKCLLEGVKVSFIDLEGEEARSLFKKLNQDNKLPLRRKCLFCRGSRVLV